MLRFDKASREKIDTIEQSWTWLAQEFAGSVRQPTVKLGKWDQIKGTLKAVEKDEMQLTLKQLDRIISDYDTENPKDADLANSIKKVKEKLAIRKDPNRNSAVWTLLAD